MPAAPPADGCRREVTTAHQLLRKLYMLAGASVGIGAGVSAAIQREVPQSMKGVKRQACASLHRLRRRTRPSRRVLAEGADEKLRGAYRVAGAAMGTPGAISSWVCIVADRGVALQGGGVPMGLQSEPPLVSRWCQDKPFHRHTQASQLVCASPCCACTWTLPRTKSPGV